MLALVFPCCFDPVARVLCSLWHKLEFKLLVKCFRTSCPDGMFGVGGLNSEILCPGAVRGLPRSFSPNITGDPGQEALEQSGATDAILFAG